MGRRRKASDAPPHPHPHASARERNLALALALTLALAFTLVRARPAAVARARRAVADGMSLAASALSSSSSSLESTPIQVACVGDSITWGYMASSAGPHGNTTYPAILQRLLDEKVGAGAYEVSMFALGGTTMSRTGDKPYWDTQEFDAFVARGRWDTVVVMLGTNDAKDAADGGPANWQHDCGGALDPSAPTLGGCSYAIDYAAFLRVASALGNPRVLVAAPPPLMQAKAYGMNQTVINTVLKPVLELVAARAGLEAPIDVFGALGGTPGWRESFPPSCQLSSEWAPCALYCDEQACDQCHPNDAGYACIAQAVFERLVVAGS